jgi:hypothetical protein
LLTEALTRPGAGAPVPSFLGLEIARALPVAPDPRRTAEELKRLRSLGYIQ